MTELRTLQATQPWTVPYGARIAKAKSEYGEKRDLLARHAVLHLMKSVGKLAGMFEAADHKDDHTMHTDVKLIQNMSADLVTVAMRFANLYHFDLETVLKRRVEEKNRKGFGDV